MMDFPAVVHVDRVIISQKGKRSWQLRFARHPGMIDQDRDHRYIALERDSSPIRTKSLGSSIRRLKSKIAGSDSGNNDQAAGRFLQLPENSDRKQRSTAAIGKVPLNNSDRPGTIEQPVWRVLAI